MEYEDDGGCGGRKRRVGAMARIVKVAETRFIIDKNGEVGQKRRFGSKVSLDKERGERRERGQTKGCLQSQICKCNCQTNDADPEGQTSIYTIQMILIKSIQRVR